MRFSTLNDCVEFLTCDMKQCWVGPCFVCIYATVNSCVGYMPGNIAMSKQNKEEEGEQEDEGGGGGREEEEEEEGEEEEEKGEKR